MVVTDVVEVEMRINTLLKEKTKEEQEIKELETTSNTLKGVAEELKTLQKSLNGAKDELNGCYSGEKAKSYSNELTSIASAVGDEAGAVEREISEMKNKMTAKKKNVEMIEQEINRLKRLQIELESQAGEGPEKIV